MWRIENQTPFAVDRTWIRDENGAEVWVVAVKATYDLLPDGSTRVSKRQEVVNSATVFHEDGSPIHETDLGPAKNATDVWLAGHAWSQSGKPITHMEAGFELGPIKRKALITGDRESRPFLQGGSSGPIPFLRIPLTWARAYGGDGPDYLRTGNPVGCGISKDNQGRTRIPNIEATGYFQQFGQEGMGFGPQPRHWPARHKFAGTYDEVWRKTRAPLQALDVDPLHWQVVSKSQQVHGRVRGGELLTLCGVTPPGFSPSGIYRAYIPKLTLGFRTRFYDGSLAITRSVIHNLILLSDQPAISIVHHMVLPCHSKVNLLEATFVTEKLRPLEKSVNNPVQVHRDDISNTGAPDWRA